MSNGSSFSWLAFLLGLAIGLWISFVVFFLIDHDDDDSCCGAGGTNILAFPGPDEAWAPGGDNLYICTNDDRGRAIVIDRGRAVVVDQGRAIVIGNGKLEVDRGRAVVVDAGSFAPVPQQGDNELDTTRDFEDFQCDSNDQGGAVVADRAGRIAVVAMPSSFASDQCHSVNGDAVVVNSDGEITHITSSGTVYTEEGSAIVSDGNADSANDKTLPAEPRSTTQLSYCMVAMPDSEPIVYRP